MEIIFNLLSLTEDIKENHFHLNTLIWMLDWTFRARGLLNYGPIEVEIYIDHYDICRRLPCELDIFLLQQQQNLGQRFDTRPPVAKAAVCTKVVDLLLLTFCLLLLPLCDSVIVLCSVVRYFMPF